MSQFGGGGKPGGWGRPGGGGGQLPGFGGLGGVGSFGMMGVGMPMINQAAFAQPGMISNMGMGMMGTVPGQRGGPAVSSAPGGAVPGKSRTFVGVVTKMHESYGFVDDDVFFQHTVIRGVHPRVGDKVMVEASYNANMPFKWNAYRVQLLTGSGITDNVPSAHRGPSPKAKSATAKWTTPASGDRNGSAGGRASPTRRRSPPRRSPPRRSSPVRSAPRKKSPPPPTRRSPRRTPPRAVSKDKDKERKRERSEAQGTSTPRKESASPPRRRARIIPRYECRSVKPLLVGDKVSQVHIRERYSRLYVPSDFVELDADWAKRVGLDSDIDMANPVSFHVFNKDVDRPNSNSEKENDTILDPEDADSRHQVKVILLAHPGKQEILKRSYGLQPEGTLDEMHEVTSISRQIHFLVGTRGKEMMAIGGCWSPSLDGSDPTNPSTLINTAVRTTKALTGIDLSGVPQWYSMLQLRYYRAEKDRVDRVHLLWPDTQLLMPADESSWQEQVSMIQRQLDEKLAAVEALTLDEPPPQPPKSVAVEPEAAVKEEPESSKVKDEEMTPADEEALKELEKQKPKPSHWNSLDVKVMKVAELKIELEARGLESRGIKTMLAQRLQEALDKEQELEEDGPPDAEGLVVKDDTANEEKMNTSEDEAKKATEEEEKEFKRKSEEYQKKLEQLVKEKKEKKAALEKSFVLPKEQKVFVYPSRTAKGGKFDCRTVSLHSLLDYRVDDNKESQFEVSLFAEAFSNLLERNACFKVYHALVSSADKDSERKRRDEARKEKKEDDKPDRIADPEKPEEKKEETEKEKEKVEKIELKPVIANRRLFEAFAFFDMNLCSYLADKDLEELLLNGELGLSRSQVTKVVHKWSSRERVTYRYLTDNLVDSDGIVKFEPGQADGAPSMEDLAKNCGYGFGVDGASSSHTTNTVATSDGTVVINGNIVNVAQKLALLKKSEQERDAARTSLNEQSALLVNLREAKQELERKKKEIEKDLEKTKKKLHDTSSSLKEVQDNSSHFKTALSDIRRYADRIASVVEKVSPSSPKTSEKKEKEKSGERDNKEHKSSSDKPEEEDIIASDALVLSDEAGPDAEAEAAVEAEANTKPAPAEEAKTEGNPQEETAMDTTENPDEHVKT